MPIRTAKHCRLHAEPSDGFRILAMRWWPKGLRRDGVDAWMKDLAPSEGLLRWCRNQKQSGRLVDPMEFYVVWRDRYVAEMESQREAIADLRARHESGETITLLCACHDPDDCHRSVLADLILNGSDAS